MARVGWCALMASVLCRAVGHGHIGCEYFHELRMSALHGRLALLPAMAVCQVSHFVGSLLHDSTLSLTLTLNLTLTLTQP